MFRDLFPTYIIDYLWSKFNINRWLLSTLLFYHRWIPQVQNTRFVSGMYLVDDSSVTSLGKDVRKLQERLHSIGHQTLVVIYDLDCKRYAIMIDPVEFDVLTDDIIPYNNQDVHRGYTRPSENDYLSVDYEGSDVTESFLMYFGPLGNSHSDKKYAVQPRYRRMIDAQGRRLFQGTTDYAIGILRSDLGALQHIKISEDYESESSLT